MFSLIEFYLILYSSKFETISNAVIIFKKKKGLNTHRSIFDYKFQKKKIYIMLEDNQSGTNPMSH